MTIHLTWQVHVARAVLPAPEGWTTIYTLEMQ